MKEINIMDQQLTMFCVIIGKLLNATTRTDFPNIISTLFRLEGMTQGEHFEGVQNMMTYGIRK